MTIGDLLDALMPLLLEGTVTRDMPVVLMTDEAECRCHPLKEAMVGGYHEWGYPWHGGEFFTVDTEEMQPALGLRPEG